MFLKKITIFSLMFFFWFSSAFADTVKDFNDVMNSSKYTKEEKDAILDTQISKPDWWTYSIKDAFNAWDLTDGKSNKEFQQITKELNNVWTQSKFACESSKDAICSDKFEIDTKLFSPGWTGLNKASSEKTINWFMTVLIKKLMVALGSLALLIMVVWAWFMIFAMWKDENLNKWKTIFKAWLISLAIALSSYYMVSFLSYILYTTN